MRSGRSSPAWVLLAALGCAPLPAATDAGSDAGTDAGSDAGIDGGADAGAVDAGPHCTLTDAGCGLDCDPADTWRVLDAKALGSPFLVHLGDSAPVPASVAGDGKHHLYVGVKHDELDAGWAGRWAVLIHDATADDPRGPYALAPQPVVSQLDTFDAFGIETPSYLRWDARTEYLYYCGLYTSYDTSDGGMTRGRIAALKRVDRGAWQKLGPVAPLTPGATSQCEPDAVKDPRTGRVRLMFITDGTPDFLRTRWSSDPESFPTAGETGARDFFPRVGTSWDPYAQVWRFSLDCGLYQAPGWLAQTWALEADPDGGTMVANSGYLHLGNHALHPAIHANQVGSVMQSAQPVFPAVDEVVFFYSAFDDGGVLAVNAQRCRRRQ